MGTSRDTNVGNTTLSMTVMYGADGRLFYSLSDNSAGQLHQLTTVELKARISRAETDSARPWDGCSTADTEVSLSSF